MSDAPLHHGVGGPAVAESVCVCVPLSFSVARRSYCVLAVGSDLRRGVPLGRREARPEAPTPVDPCIDMIRPLGRKIAVQP